MPYFVDPSLNGQLSVKTKLGVTSIFCPSPIGIFQLDLSRSGELCADFNEFEFVQYGVGFRRFLISIRSVSVDITACHNCEENTFINSEFL